MTKSGKYTPQDFAKVQEVMSSFSSSVNNNAQQKVNTVSRPCTLVPNTPSNVPQPFPPLPINNTHSKQASKDLSITRSVPSDLTTSAAQAFKKPQTIVAKRSLPPPPLPTPSPQVATSTVPTSTPHISSQLTILESTNLNTPSS